jgi:hypothetical protein
LATDQLDIAATVGPRRRRITTHAAIHNAMQVVTPREPFHSRSLQKNCHGKATIELAEALDQVVNRCDSEALLDRYERRRRAMNIEFVQQATF